MERDCVGCGEVATHSCACSHLYVCFTCLLSHIGEEPGKSHITVPIQFSPLYNSSISSMQQKLDILNANKETFESNKANLLLDLQQVQAKIAPLATKLIEELSSTSYKESLISVIEKCLKDKKEEVNSSANQKIIQIQAIQNTVRQIDFLELKGDHFPWDSVIWNYSADVKQSIIESVVHKFTCDLEELGCYLNDIINVSIDLDFTQATAQKLIYAPKANSCALEVYDVTLEEGYCQFFKGDPIPSNAPCFLLPDASVVVVGTVTSASKVQRILPDIGKVKSYKPLANDLSDTLYAYTNGCIYSINRVANHVLNLHTKVWSEIATFDGDFVPLSVGACSSFICVVGNSNKTLCLRKFTLASQTWEAVWYTATLEQGCHFISLPSTLVLVQNDASFYMTEDGIESIRLYDPIVKIKSTICLDGKKAKFYYVPEQTPMYGAPKQMPVKSLYYYQPKESSFPVVEGRFYEKFRQGAINYFR